MFSLLLFTFTPHLPITHVDAVSTPTVQSYTLESDSEWTKTIRQLYSKDAPKAKKVIVHFEPIKVAVAVDSIVSRTMIIREYTVTYKQKPLRCRDNNTKKLSTGTKCSFIILINTFVPQVPSRHPMLPQPLDQVDGPYEI